MFPLRLANPEKAYSVCAESIGNFVNIEDIENIMAPTTAPTDWLEASARSHARMSISAGNFLEKCRLAYLRAAIQEYGPDARKVSKAIDVQPQAVRLAGRLLNIYVSN